MENTSLNNVGANVVQEVFVYEGPVSMATLLEYGSLIRRYVEQKILSNKLFRIFIEIAQNVAHYSEEFIIDNDKRIGVGKVSLFEAEEYFELQSSNLVKKEDAHILCERCNMINSSDNSELRSIKRYIRSDTAVTRIGARIGLVQIALTAESKVDCVIEDAGHDISKFSISIKTRKNNTSWNV